MTISDLYIGKRFEFGGIEWQVSFVSVNSFWGETLEEDIFDRSELRFKDRRLIDIVNWH